MAHVCIFIRCFNQILNAVTSPTFYKTYVKLPTQSTPLAPYIADNPKLFPFFKGAIGALVGTHILHALLQTDPTISTTKEGSHRMSWLPLHLTCTFATSSVDGREVPQMGGVFHDAHLHDLCIPDGKYYLADVGYPICEALLVPFHGVQYHL